MQLIHAILAFSLLINVMLYYFYYAKDKILNNTFDSFDRANANAKKLIDINKQYESLISQLFKQNEEMLKEIEELYSVIDRAYDVISKFNINNEYNVLKNGIFSFGNKKNDKSKPN